MPIKLLILAPYPKGTAPSQRFRFEHYLGALEGKEIEYTYKSFLLQSTWDILYKRGYKFRKIVGICLSFLFRFWLMLWIWKYDVILIHREASPIGPPIFEWIIRFVWRKPYVYDFDDAIWLPNTSEQNKIVAKIKWHGKVAKICTWASQICAGNAYLAEYAKKYNKNTVVLPTVVDTEFRHNTLQNQETERVCIGWTGSHSTLDYLLPLLPTLKQLGEKYDFDFYVICNDPSPLWEIKNFYFIPWQEETEIEDLLRFHVGLMPLTDDAWAAGKCGFKAIQYMALGIIPVVSPVGVNTQIVSHEETGYHAISPEEWEKILAKLFENKGLRQEMSSKARQFIQENYSVKATFPIFLAALRAALA